MKDGWLVKMVLALNLACCGAALLIVVLGPSPDGAYAVYAPTGTAAVAIVAAAGGSLVAVSDDGRTAVTRGEAGLRSRLVAAGAVLVFNPVLARGCKS
jgi:hypothetical protein